MHAALKTRRLVVVELGRDYPTTDRTKLQALSRRLLALLDERNLGTVAIDLSKTEEFGAGLLSVLVRAYRHAERQGHEMVFCGVRGMAKEIFALAKLDRVWTFLPSRMAVMDRLGVDRISRIVTG
jgi:anti-anti-sigma regulatory factor